ncbi:MAG: DUF1207 domain-containing protein [Planctomycetia bacterium]|jgi:hypothetical protein
MNFAKRYNTIFLVACLGMIVMVATAAGEPLVQAMPASEVWIPEGAFQPNPLPQREPGSVRLVDYEEAAAPSEVNPAPDPSESTVADADADYEYDPSLIVPLDEVGPELTTSQYGGQQYSTMMSVTPETVVPGTMVPGSFRVLQTSDPLLFATDQSWRWQILPSGLLWHSYLAGPREPRISSTFFRIRKDQDYWDATVGGRAALLRLGNNDSDSPEGIEVQVEGAAFPRLTLDYARDLVASDYRFGFPLVYRRGALEAKFAYYHISAHLADEYIMTHPGALAERINYSRDALTLAVGFYPWRDLRLYSEVGYAVWCDGGSRPWEFQFGVDYSPARPTSIWGAPFMAVNGHLHQELNYGGGLTAQAGVQWRGQSGRLLRMGFQYFNGMSEQYQFYRQFEQQLGGGVWYDF